MRNDFPIPDLIFPAMTYGEQETPWDLKMLLYFGGARVRRNIVLKMIGTGKLGDPLPERLELVRKIHEVINDILVSGGSQHSADSAVEKVRAMFAWAELAGCPLTLDNIEATYLHWADALDHRCRVVRNLSKTAAYNYAVMVGRVLNRALDRQAQLILLTRLTIPLRRKTARGVQAEKQNLQNTFLFGHLLQDICDGLSVEVILKSPLPVRISLRCRGELVDWSGYTRAKERENLKGRILDTCVKRQSAKRSDANWTAFECEGTLLTRYPLANLRIEAEHHMFIGQTGMNLAQTHQLKLRHFFYVSHLDSYQVKDRKYRRSGEVLFEIFKEYKPHFERYLAWRRELFHDSDQLFPLISKGRAERAAPQFSRIRKKCKESGIPYVPPSSLRNTRINWFLRHSGDADMTAEMAQHSKETLLKVYERPSLHRAMGEIMRFWAKNDPAIVRTISVAPGECDGQPMPVKSMPKEAPQPDCTQASGCLWCEHYRDIDSQDYCWSLACFRHLKIIEVSKWRALQKSTEIHPAEFAITRISNKLHWFQESNAKRQTWIDEALARVEEGRYHPDWKRLIEDMEGTS